MLIYIGITDKKYNYFLYLNQGYRKTNTNPNAFCDDEFINTGNQLNKENLEVSLKHVISYIFVKKVVGF